MDKRPASLKRISTGFPLALIVSIILRTSSGFESSGFRKKSLLSAVRIMSSKVRNSILRNRNPRPTAGISVSSWKLKVENWKLRGWLLVFSIRIFGKSESLWIWKSDNRSRLKIFEKKFCFSPKKIVSLQPIFSLYKKYK